MDRRTAKARLPLLALVLLALLATAVAMPISGEAKKGPAKCKGNKIPVKVNGKASCKPLSAALPKPKPIDPRLAYLRAALNLDVSKLDGRHGKRPRSLKRGFGAAGKKARKAFLRGVPKLLAMIDGLADGGQRPTRARAGTAAASSARCGPGDGAASDTGKTDGLSIQANVGANGAKGGTMQFETNGQTFNMTFTTCGGGFSVPECPAANGDVDGSGRGQFFVTIRILQGGTLVSSQSTSTDYQDKLHGKVAADARLDYLDFESTAETLIIATGGTALRDTTVRQVRVNMRSASPKYDPAKSSVTIRGDDLNTANGRRIAEEVFAANVADAIKTYRATEAGWSTFDRQGGSYCAKAVFSPASGTHKLRKGQHDQVSIYAQARDGGRAADARWDLIETSNATFSPSPASGPAPTINVDVSANPTGNKVRVTVKFTSTAGVGKDTWTQDIGDVPLFLGEVEGSSTEDQTDPEAGCDVHYSYNYESDLSANTDEGGPAVPFRIHPQIPGEDEDNAAFGHVVTGSGNFSKAACHEDPACSTSLEPDGVGDVQFHVQGNTVEVTVWTSPWKNDSTACDGPLSFSEARIGDASFPLSMLDQQTIVVPVSFDLDDGDASFAGSGTLTLNRVG